MIKNVYWITAAHPHRIAIVARPRGGDWLSDDIKALSRNGIEVLASLLTPGEVSELGLSEEGRFCDQWGIKFLNLPIEDRSVPDELEVCGILETLVKHVKLERGVGFHSRACIGRSSILAALVLARLGWTPEAAFRAIGEARGCRVPDTIEQEHWVQSCVGKFPRLTPHGFRVVVKFIRP